MELEGVMGSLLTDVGKQAEAIKEEGKSEAKEIRNDARAEVREHQKKIHKKTDARINEFRKREETRVTLELRRTKLNNSNALLEAIFSKAVEKISNLPTDKREAFLGSILPKGESIDATKIYCSPKEKQSLLKLKPKQKIETMECLGGIVFENKDGSVRLDHTYDSVLANLRKTKANKLMGIIYK